MKQTQRPIGQRIAMMRKLWWRGWAAGSCHYLPLHSRTYYNRNSCKCEQLVKAYGSYASNTKEQTHKQSLSWGLRADPLPLSPYCYGRDGLLQTNFRFMYLWFSLDIDPLGTWSTTSLYGSYIFWIVVLLCRWNQNEWTNFRQPGKKGIQTNHLPNLRGTVHRYICKFCLMDYFSDQPLVKFYFYWSLF